MSCGLIHFNPTIFSSPYSFLPDRFLQDKHLDRYLLSFSKGSRQCAGINVAYTQLYLCVSGLFRRYGAKSCPGPEGYLELFETDRGDVELRHDFFVPYGRMGSKGIRVTVEK
jgi:cytochrome P450